MNWEIGLEAWGLGLGVRKLGSLSASSAPWREVSVSRKAAKFAKGMEAVGEVGVE